jgi:antitoxin HicB
MKNSRGRKPATFYEVDVVPNEQGGFYARVPDFPTIFTGGATAAEAVRNAQEAIALMVEEYRERNLPPPRPKSAFSGHFNIRVPKELHRDLARRADEEGVSLNALVTVLLARSGPPEMAAKMVRTRRKRAK